MFRKMLLIATPVFLSSSIAHAQYAPGKNEIGLQGGLMVYQGDLSPSAIGSYKTMRLQGNAYFNHIISPFFSIRGGLTLGSLAGDESLYHDKNYRQKRAFSFSSSVTELSALLVWNAYGDNERKQLTRFSPYAFAGIGYGWYNIHPDWSRTKIDSFHANSAVLSGLAIDTIHSNPRSMPVIPIGIGAKYALGKHWSLTGELAYRYTFTDYLDGFSHAANPGKNDSYYTVSFGLLYNLGKDMSKCPTAR